MSVDELLDSLPPSVADLLRALLDVRTLSSGSASKKNNERINQIAGAALVAFERTISEMEWHD